jgi:hypothetical protein
MSTVAAIAPVDAAADPHWFPECFDQVRGEICLVQTDSNDLSVQTFLDHRWKRDRAQRVRLRIEELRQQRSNPSPLAIIWHTGFCCSTLLAKALQNGWVLSLCEPQILPEIADAGREGLFARNAGLRGLPRFTLDLLARPLEPNSAIVLKPAPAANVLLPEAARRPNTRNLFLYSDCRSFLISIAGQKEDGAKYARRMFLNIVGDGHPQFQWPPARLFLLSDLEIAALVWHIQIAEFRRALPLLGANPASLDCEALLARPVTALEGVANYFRLPVVRPSATVLARNAKNPSKAYDAETRRARHAEIAHQLGPDLDRIVEWSYDVSSGTPRGAPLPNALLETEKIYP